MSLGNTLFVMLVFLLAQKWGGTDVVSVFLCRVAGEADAEFVEDLAVDFAKHYC